MESNPNDRRLQTSFSLDFQSNNKSKDNDTISYASLNTEPHNSLYYLPSNVNKYLHQRQISNKRLLNSIVNHTGLNGNGLIINGSLFDEQLFQPTRSSYITDYANTPQDFNRFLQGHNATLVCSQLDAHLFKVAFIITLSDWYVDKEILLGYYPHDDNEVNILEEISPYKRFCFPELNPKERNGGQLVHDQSTYIFTRTLSDGHVEYGYCRRLTKDYNQITKFPIVICIGNHRNLSYLRIKNRLFNSSFDLSIF
jgi:hypothetical protein